MSEYRYVPNQPQKSASDIAFERWASFLFYPGIGWVGFALAWILWADHPTGAIVAVYVTLYASCAYAWPSFTAAFWRGLLASKAAKAVRAATASAAIALDSSAFGKQERTCASQSSSL
ncbi:MAG: hypothetical protein ABW199_09280 [Caulobacterales bacterium]